MELKSWELELLNSTYRTNLERRKIACGQPYDYMLAALGQARRLLACLEQRYPGYHFVINRFEPANIDTVRDFYSISPENDRSLTAHALYYKDEDIFRDDFYSILLEPEYDSLLAGKMRGAGLSFKGLYTFFKVLCGDDCPRPADASRLLTESADPIRDTEIFIAMPADNEACQSRALDQVKAICAYLADAGIHGSFRIYYSARFTSEMSTDACWRLWREEKEGIRVVSFTGSTFTEV